MKTKWIFVISLVIVVTFILMISEQSFGYRNFQQKPADTITYYQVWRQHYKSGKKDVYKVDGHVVSKRTYDKYPMDDSAIFKCKPCYLKVYGKDMKIKYEGDMYTDCPIGSWTEYHLNGKPKVTGNFFRDSTINYDTVRSARWCSVRHGEWRYYNQAGKIDSIVHYVNGVRTK